MIDKFFQKLCLLALTPLLMAMAPGEAVTSSELPDIRLPQSALPGVQSTLNHAVGAPDKAPLQTLPAIQPAITATVPTTSVPASTFFPVLPLGAPPDTEPELVPVASNHPLTGDHRGLTRAVIVIHDFSRDAGASLSLLGALAGNANGSTIILAPQFLLDSDIQRFQSHLPDGGKMFARWPFAGSPTDAAASVAITVPGQPPTPPVLGWRLGGDSLALSQQHGISSFTVADLLLLFLADRNNFPDLREIIMVGHGEGGDFVQRYAAAGQAPDVLDAQQLAVRFVVMNASSYLYLTPSRMIGTTESLKVPDAAACATANDWPYGLDNLPTYGKRVGANAIKLRYVTREVVYLTGDSAARNDPAPDVACAALQQGADRYARFLGYQNYLTASFAEAAGKLQSFHPILATGYDAAAMYSSSCAMTQIFSDGQCAQPLRTGTHSGMMQP